MQIYKALVPVLALGLWSGCGGKKAAAPATPGTLNITLGSDSIPGYTNVVVSVNKLEWSPDGSHWGTLSTLDSPGSAGTPAILGNADKTFDLEALENGNGGSAAMMPAVTLEPATIQNFRITWSNVNYASASHSASYVNYPGPSSLLSGALTMPVQSVTVVSANIPLASNATVHAQIMLAGNQAVQSRAGGTTFSFQPTGTAYDLATTATITGNLSDGSTGLAGVEVYAEALDGNFKPSIVRRSITDASGNYVLDALPVALAAATTSTAYYVVTQPSVSGIVYPAQASAPITVSTATGYTANMTFTPPIVAACSMQVTVSPASLATEGTWVELQQPLATGSGSQTFIVRSLTVDSYGTQSDTVTFSDLAPTIVGYGVVAYRSLSGATPTAVISTAPVPVSAAVSPATCSLTYPAP